MPAAARGKFFFSISLQISQIAQIFLMMLFVALASLSYIPTRLRASMKAGEREW